MFQSRVQDRLNDTGRSEEGGKFISRKDGKGNISNQVSMKKKKLTLR